MIKFFGKTRNKVKQKKLTIQNELESGLAKFWLSTYKYLITQLKEDWITSQPFWLELSLKQRFISYLEFSLLELNKVHANIEKLRRLHQKFLIEYHAENDTIRKQNLVIEFCANLKSTDLKGDKKAFSRWFDQQAAIERWQKALQDSEFEATFLINRIQYFFEKIAEHAKHDNLTKLWQQFDFENDLFNWLKYKYEPRLQIAGFKCLSNCAQLISINNFSHLSPEIMRYSYRFALDKSLPIELQIEALKLLAVIDINQAKELIDNRINNPTYADNKDELFFKASLPELISIYHFFYAPMGELFELLISDDSDLVRQRCITALPCVSERDEFQNYINLFVNDSSDAVFHMFVTQIPFLVYDFNSVDLMLSILSKESNSDRVRSCLIGLENAFSVTSTSDNEQAIFNKIYDTLSKLSVIVQSELSQYYIIQTREKIWASAQKDLCELLTPLISKQSVRKMVFNETQKQALQSERGKRWLAAQNQYGFSMELNNSALNKGERFGFRLWRFYHEFMHPATDKRQHHTHVIGRIYTEHAYIPSQVLAEVSPTKVPGEPLHIENEGHWRPFLPLVDQFISSLDQGWPSKPIQIFHVTGITEIIPPNNPIKRLSMRTLLTFKFNYYAKLRNWQNNDKFSPKKYIAEMRKLGFTINFIGYDVEPDAYDIKTVTQERTIPAANKFFSVTWPTFLMSFSTDFQRYFVSIYQNSIQHILLFSTTMIGIFWGTHIWLNQKIKRARAKIPTVIGGWGTRGKSGTERLKAALLNALGLSIVSKTTGCEAMFLYSGRNGTLKEMFLFRPYDKATIWEQAFVTRLTANLNADVLCWECMGLTPKFIDILQQQWMRDDLVTITNCFPDHEDLQGPAGIDIPQTIAKFISKNSQAWTTEVNMLPYLQSESERKNAKLQAVNWLDVALIPQDLLDRFPYQEHPANIALVAAMSAEFQIDKYFAIKHMADNVVPDIGVLQTFPYSPCKNRNVRFINGFSANERYGAMSNWERIQFNQPCEDDVLRITLINNRADRVPRSKVFAALVANDFATYKHVLIGNNLDGFLLFAEQEWSERLDKNFAEIEDRQRLISVCSEFTDFLTPYSYKDTCRIECDELLIEAGLNDSADTFWTETELTLRIEKIKRKLTQLFLEKFIVVEDYFISGNQLNQLIVESMPENHKIDILGLQNIKGPGLDFVYQWQQWHFTHQMLNKISDSDNTGVEAILTEVNNQELINVLEYETLKSAIPTLMESNVCQTESAQIMLKQLQKKVNDFDFDSREQKTKSKITHYLTSAVEGVLDIFDAINRGYVARVVLFDLSKQRISLNKAASILKSINKRQKGGWLK